MPSSNELYEQAHIAICTNRWADAQTLLEELLKRDDAAISLLPGAFYDNPNQMREVIRDRLKLVESKLEG